MNTLEDNSKEVASILKYLAHPKRLMILCKLRDSTKTVGELEKGCTISQSQLSQFLGKMKEEGILISEKSGQFVSYSIGDARITKLINSIQHIFCSE